MKIMTHLANITKNFLKDANNEFNSIILKLVDGKQINYCLKGSYQTKHHVVVVSDKQHTKQLKILAISSYNP